MRLGRHTVGLVGVLLVAACTQPESMLPPTPTPIPTTAAPAAKSTPTLPLTPTPTLAPTSTPATPRLWTRQFGTSGYDFARAVAVDPEGNVYVAGRTEGALPGQVSSGDFDAFVRKYDRDGDEVWTRQFGTPESTTPVPWRSMRCMVAPKRPRIRRSTPRSERCQRPAALQAHEAAACRLRVGF